MFVIVATYRARAGEEDAIMALHEGKSQDQQFNASIYHSWQLLRKVDESQEFISIAQFADEKQAHAATKELEKDGWYSRLLSLMDGTPKYTNYRVVWSLH